MGSLPVINAESKLSEIADLERKIKIVNGAHILEKQCKHIPEKSGAYEYYLGNFNKNSQAKMEAEDFADLKAKGHKRGEVFSKKCGKKTAEIVKYSYNLLEEISTEQLKLFYDSEQVNGYAKQAKAAILNKSCIFLKKSEKEQLEHLVSIKKDIITQNYGAETLAKFEPLKKRYSKSSCTNANKEFVAESFKHIKEQLGFSDFAGFLTVEGAI